MSKFQIPLYLLVILEFFDFNSRDKQTLKSLFRIITWDGKLVNKEIYRHLSKRDLCEILDLTHQTPNCTDHDVFKKNVLDLKDIFPFESSVCAYGNIETALFQKVPQIKLLDISYPKGYLDLYFKNSITKPTP